MIDHITLKVRDFDRALDFYKVALAPLGYQVLMEFPGTAGLGVDGKPDFWIARADHVVPTHVAFGADRDEVDHFHKAALAAGGTDNGAPGLRPDYHPSYYAAFVLDPDGNNVEAVCHAPPAAPRARKPAKKAAKKAAPAKTAKKAASRPAKKAGKKPAAKRSATKRAR
jgi:catechol 2,3-dioxygenase-like lactoylglutathione lyase family enzyme